MPYIENRIVHDADAHTMELPNWYEEFGTKRVQDAFKERFKGNKGLAHTYFDDIEEVHKRALIKIKMKKILWLERTMTP